MHTTGKTSPPKKNKLHLTFGFYRLLFITKNKSTLIIVKTAAIAIKTVESGPAPKKMGMGPIRITPPTLPEPENTVTKITIATPKNTKDTPIIINPSSLRETKKPPSFSSVLLNMVLPQQSIID